MAFQFSEQNARENQRGAKQDTTSEMLASEKPRSDRRENRLQADQDRGVRWRSVLLGPGLEREADGSGTNGGDQDCKD